MTRPSAMRFRGVAAVAALGVVAAAAGVFGTGSAVASGVKAQTRPADDTAVHKDLTFNCTFPLVGPKDVVAGIDINIPATGTVGQLLATNGLVVNLTLDADIAAALYTIGGRSIDGSASTDVDMGYAGIGVSIAVNGLGMPATSVPESGGMPITIYGSLVGVSPEVSVVPGLYPKVAGDVTFAVGPTFTAQVNTYKDDGTPTDLGSFPLPCTANPGQDMSLATVSVS